MTRALTGACVVGEWASNHRTLTHLGMRGTQVTDEGALQLIGAVVHHDALISLDLRESGVGPRALHKLCETLQRFQENGPQHVNGRRKSYCGCDLRL